MERASFKFCFAHICFEKGRLGDVSSSPDDLLCGPINADDRVPQCSEITRDWDACTTTRDREPDRGQRLTNR
jgi:hypothetical protein